MVGKFARSSTRVGRVVSRMAQLVCLVLQVSIQLCILAIEDADIGSGCTAEPAVFLKNGLSKGDQ